MEHQEPKSRRTALVTGSARGIGKEIALVLGKHGYSVMLSDINQEALSLTEKEFVAAGITAVSCVANVSKSEDAEKLVEATLKTFGHLDVLVNNAGITKDGLLLRMTEDQWDAVINVNLKGTFLMSKAVCRPMLKQKSGCLVNIASVIGLIGNGGQANYAASKAGIIAFTKSFAKEFGRKGIRANAVAPGFIQTEMTHGLPENVKEEMLRNIPMGVLGTPTDVANAVVFLASDQASYITGQVLTVDGGMVMS